MRLFIAIRLSDAMRDAALAVQRELRYQGVRGNYSAEANLHLTLAFIGEYPDAAPVLEAIRESSLKPFELQLEGLRLVGETWCLGLKQCPPLMAYAGRLRRILSEAGIPFDPKRFTPHITLLRRAEWDRPGMPPVDVPPASMLVERASLMRSDRGRSGVVYTEING